MEKTRIIIDENLSSKLMVRLADMFSSVTHVSSEGLIAGLDLDIWNHAKNHSLTILTKDTDFRNLSSTFGCPPKVIRINCGNKTTMFIAELLVSRRKVINNFLADDTDCYLEIT